VYARHCWDASRAGRGEFMLRRVPPRSSAPSSPSSCGFTNLLGGVSMSGRAPTAATSALKVLDLPRRRHTATSHRQLVRNMLRGREKQQPTPPHHSPGFDAQLACVRGLVGLVELRPQRALGITLNVLRSTAVRVALSGGSPPTTQMDA
jgi:hypothetical protein